MTLPIKPGLKAMCIFMHNDKTLATVGSDKVTGEKFYRLVGGGIHFGEKSEDGVRREVREELKCEIRNLKLVDVVENIFSYEGKTGHEIVFLYTGTFSDMDLYNKEKIRITEPYGEFDAEWISMEEVLSKKITLYPSFDYFQIFTKG
jgi:ADP-ribose pyrophosphatase YjhB (NUDIX family)